MNTVLKKGPAKTIEELRNHAYNLVVSYDQRLPLGDNRSDVHWFRIKKQVLEVLIERGNSDPFDLSGVVSQVIDFYRDQGKKDL